MTTPFYPLIIASHSFSLSRSFLQICVQTVVATIAIVLRSLKLYETMSAMYERVVDIVAAQQCDGCDGSDRDEILREGLVYSYLSHLRVLGDIHAPPPLTSDQGSNYDHNAQSRTELSMVPTLASMEINNKTSIEKTDSVHHVNNDHDENNYIRNRDQVTLDIAALRRWELAQLSAVRLARCTPGNPLYLGWCAYSALEGARICRRLVERLGLDSTDSVHQRLSIEEGDDINDESSIVDLLSEVKRKGEVLPRLAESFSSRAIACTRGAAWATSETVSKEKGEGEKVPVDVEEWRRYLESLETRGEWEGVVRILKENVAIPFSNWDGENSLALTKPTTVPMTERERLERLAEAYSALGDNENSSNTFKSLLLMMPDQWSYWLGLMRSSGTDVCKKALSCHLSNNDSCCEFSPSLHKTLRSPSLFLVEMACHDASKEGDSFRFADAIIRYAELMSPTTLCCFQDLRLYIRLMVKHSVLQLDKSVSLPLSVLRILKWAKAFREDSKNNPFSNNPLPNISDVISNNEKEKREHIAGSSYDSKLLVYLNSVKICMEILNCLLFEYKQNSKRKEAIAIIVLDECYVPSPHMLMDLWMLSCGFSNEHQQGPQEYKRKDPSPISDSLVILASQLLFYHVQSTLGSTVSSAEQEATKFLATSMLEGALFYSPNSPTLKIALLRAYLHLGAISRAWEIFNNLGIQHIQLDSCSYLILPHLSSGGLYAEAVKHSSNILRLHSSSSEDIGEHASRSFENGNMTVGGEMVHWKRGRMGPSLQLLEARCVIMDMATLIHQQPRHSHQRLRDSHNSNVLSSSVSSIVAEGGGSEENEGGLLGILHGICGKDDDGCDTIRARYLAAESRDHYTAPFLFSLSYSSNGSRRPPYLSDNRDLSLTEQFEILDPMPHPSMEDMTIQAIWSGLDHNVMIKHVLLIDAARPPKKGKLQINARTNRRCCSLLDAVEEAWKNHHHQQDQYKKDLNERNIRHLPTPLSISVCCNNYKVNGDIFGIEMSDLELSVSTALRCASLALARISSITVGVLFNSTVDDLPIESDTLAIREERCVAILESVVQGVTTAAIHVATSKKNGIGWSSCEHGVKDVIGTVCRLLSKSIVPVFAHFRTTARLFEKYGWGKRKRKTKEIARVLSELAAVLMEVIKGLKEALEQAPSGIALLGIPALEGERKHGGITNEFISNKVKEHLAGMAQKTGEIYLRSTEERCGITMLGNVVDSLEMSQKCAKERTIPFLNEILEELGRYDVEIERTS